VGAPSKPPQEIGDTGIGSLGRIAPQKRYAPRRVRKGGMHDLACRAKQRIDRLFGERDATGADRREAMREPIDRLEGALDLEVSAQEIVQRILVFKGREPA